MKIKSLKGILFIAALSFVVKSSALNAYADVTNEATLAFAEGSYNLGNTNTIMPSDSILVQHAGKNVLIDTGFSADKLKNFLKQNNVDKIDYLIITHSHGDHIGGINKLISEDIEYLDNLKIKAIYIKEPFDGSYLVAKDRTSDGQSAPLIRYNKLIKYANSRNIPIKTPSKASNNKISLGSGMVLNIKNTNYFEDNKSKFTPVKEGLMPTSSQNRKLMQHNDASLVVEVLHTGKQTDRMLLTGDMTNNASDYLLSEGVINKKYDLLKVPHHGTGGSSNFKLLETTQPDQAILTAASVSNENVMGKYKLLGIPVYGTSTTHHVIVKSKGNGISKENIYSMKSDGNDKKLSSITSKYDVTSSLDGAYVRKNGVNYYYTNATKTEKKQNKLVEVDFSTAQGFKFSGLDYPEEGKGYICVKNDKIQYGWQKIVVDGDINYYYFEKDTGLARKPGVYKMKRAINSKGDVIDVTKETEESYFKIGQKGECLTGFQNATINGVSGKYYFIKGNRNTENKGKLMVSKNGTFVENSNTKYWLESTGMLSKRSGTYKLSDGSMYCLSNGEVQVGFQDTTINGVSGKYYFIKGNRNTENKGKLMVSKNGTFVEEYNTKYWLESTGMLKNN